MDISRTKHSVSRYDIFSKKNNKKLKKSISAFISILFLCTSSVYADDDDALIEGNLADTYDLSRDEFDTRLKPLDFNLVGDSHDIASGGISFSVTDVSIPGNSSLEVAFRRRATEAQASHNPRQSDRRAYQPLADWVLDVPTLSTFRYRNGNEQMGVLSNAGCLTNILEDEAMHTGIGAISQLALRGGVTFNSPNSGKEQIVKTSLVNSANRWSPIDNSQFLGASKKYTTLHCRGEYSEITTQDGTVYKATKKVLIPSTSVYSRTYAGEVEFNRYKELHLVTQAQDIHGNTVNWQYDNMGRLTKISSNDGRTITVNYIGSGRHVSTVVANGRTWQYNYDTVSYSSHNWEPSGQTTVLTSVTQPDGQSWVYDIGNLTNTPVRTVAFMSERMISITHPYGTHAEFKLVSKIQEWTKVRDPHPARQHIYRSVSQKNLALIKKTITGPNIPTSQWTFTYEEPVADFHGMTDYGDDLKRVAKTGPDGGFTEYFAMTGVNSPYRGKITQEKIYVSENGSLLQESSSEYQQTTAYGEIGPDTYNAASFDAYLTKKTLSQNGDIYTTEIDYEIDAQDINYSYGQPLLVTRYSNLPNATTRYFKNTYEHNKTKWVLGLISTSRLNNKLFYEYDYDSTGRLTAVDKFEADTADYTYYTSGNQQGMISTVRDGIGRVTKYENYHRGIPEKVTRAYGTVDAVNTYREVDNNGWITSVTDGKGQKDTVQRDNMGRIKKIDPFGGWYNTIISYEFPSSGGLKQTIQRHENKLTVTYDEMLRTVLEKSEDTSSGWFTYNNFKFDSAGRKIFSSYPSTSPTHLQGITNEYDPLNRIKSEVLYPFITTSYRYLTDNKMVVTDPDGYETTIQKSGYGSVDDGAVLSIVSPESTTTQMTYDNWGNLSTMRRFGNQGGYNVDETRKYFYDSRMRLCRQHVDEIGSKLMDYDDANQLTAYSEGQIFGTSCATPSSGKVSLTYDNLGQLKLTDYSDSTPDISRAYDDNGNIMQISRGLTNWTYQYFDNDKLSAENLNIDSLNFNTSYERDSYGNISKIIYPSGDAVSQRPDAFGRPTNLTAINTGSSDVYASDIQYHFNQSIKSFKYGNGVQFKQDLNSRLLPENRVVWSEFNTVKNILDYQYQYDGRANITHITDGVDTSRSVRNTYDGLSQLKSSNSAFGDITFEYDAIGNLRKRSVVGGNAFGSSQYSTTIDFNSNNQVYSAMTGGLARSFTHDTRGNVTNNGKDIFNYDLANQPIKTSSDTFLYDGNLKRAKKSTDSGVSYFVYTKEAGLISQYNKTNSLHTDYIRLGKQLIARVESAENPADLPSKHSTERGYYLPFGKKISNENNLDNTIGFTGHVSDKSGLSYMQARYYDPVIGRFYSNDPVGYTAKNPVMSFNRYLYVNNNPYKYTDPNGEFIVQIIATVGGGIIGGAVEYLTNENASFSSVARASAVGAAVGLVSSLGGGVVSSALLGGGANASGEMANQIATGDIDGGKVLAAAATGLVGGALAKQTANVVKGALTKGLPNNSASSATHNMTQSSSQRVLADSQSLTNAGAKSTSAEIQVGTGYAAGAAVGTEAANEVCEQGAGC